MLDIFPILPYFCVVGRADMKTTLISESSELEYKREIPDDNRKWLKTVIDNHDEFFQMREDIGSRQ